jgi:CRISPR/Cas system CSM-associated protein Csm5 (group 7 of RAMP superfamily)
VNFLDGVLIGFAAGAYTVTFVVVLWDEAKRRRRMVR